VLVELAMTDHDPEVRKLAFGRLDDHSLAEIVEKDGDYETRYRAVQNLTDQAVLTEFAKTLDNLGLRGIAVGRLLDQAVLAELARTDGNMDVRKIAVERLDDQVVLAEVAKSDEEYGPRKAAVTKLEDPGLLAEVADEGEYEDIREVAAKMLKAASPAASQVKGGFGELYCSQACYSAAGHALMDLPTSTEETCDACGSLFSPEMGMVGRVGIATKAGVEIEWYCSQSCHGEGTARHRNSTTCTYCGAPLTTSEANPPAAGKPSRPAEPRTSQTSRWESCRECTSGAGMAKDVQRYILDEDRDVLSPDKRQSIEAHLDRCSRCRAVVEGVGRDYGSVFRGLDLGTRIAVVEVAVEDGERVEDVLSRL